MLKIDFMTKKLKSRNLILSPKNESHDTKMTISMLKIGFCDAKNRFSDQNIKVSEFDSESIKINPVTQK